MSVYDTTRAQAEQLCAQLNTPILRRADGDPDGGGEHDAADGG